MKAAIYRTNGTPDVLNYEDVPDPVAGAGEVLVRNEAISIEGGDLLNRLMIPLPRIPHIVGYAAAGEIIAVGQDVSDLKIGQKVATFAETGSHAELRAVRADHCWVLSEHMDLLAAACVPIAFGTAYEALFELGGLKPGQDVLIQGAAGGVALAAVQLAKKAGARVIGTGSSREQLEKLRAYGLDDGIVYGSDNLKERSLALTGGKGVDLSIDPLGGQMAQTVIESTASGGQIVLLGASSREPTMINGISLILGNHGMHGFMLSAVIHTPRMHGHIARIFERVASGELEVVVDRAFPLSEAAAAHRYAEQRGRIGRVVMVA